MGKQRRSSKIATSYDETFKLLKAEVSTVSLPEALCLYSFSKAAVAKDCKSGQSLSSLFRPFENCAMADVHWITRIINSLLVTQFRNHVKGRKQKTETPNDNKASTWLI
jgi:hypothetical protein